jgi:twitching motility protein PilT
MPRLDSFLQMAREQGCSDVHLAVGMPPLFRLHGQLMPIKFRELDTAELQGYVLEILTPAQKRRFFEGTDLDFSYMSPMAGRFRVNLFRKASGVGAVMRSIAGVVPRLSDLGLPGAVRRCALRRQGLVLVTGSTGSGKSTTLAALTREIIEQRAVNVVTLEDPIEFLYRSETSQIIQREIGTHVESFAKGLRAALRQDPDVILVGELRDRETIEIAMTAAETGHLVMGSLHTNSAAKTIDRILDALPPEARQQGVSFLSHHLVAVISQVLMRTPDGRNRRAVAEVLLQHSAISNLIRTGKTFQIPEVMRTQRDMGMQLLDQGLLDAVEAGQVDPNQAYLVAQDKQPFQRHVTDAALVGTRLGL